MEIRGADNPGNAEEKAAATASRKPLNAAFRMAVLAGALESVRLHLRSGIDLDATDDKGRSSLILAASKGRLDICRLLLEAGADPGLRDKDGNDALAIALSRGQTGIVQLLGGLREGTRVSESAESGNKSGVPLPTAESEVNSVLPYASGAAEANITEYMPQSAPGPAASNDAVHQSSVKDESLVDEDAPFDLSFWREEIDSPPPPDDPECAFRTGEFQALLSRHIPIDTDENWDDVEIDLPELEYLARRRSLFTPDNRQSIRVLIIEALRDGYVGADRLTQVLPRSDDADELDRTQSECNLRVTLGDLGVLVDDEPLVPDLPSDITNADEDRFGDPATQALNFLDRLQSADTDPLALYIRELPADRLTRDDETALGLAIENGTLDMLAALAGSPMVVSALAADARAILAGKLPSWAMFDFVFGKKDLDDQSSSEEDGEDSDADHEPVVPDRPSEFAAKLASISDLCTRANPERKEFAARLFSAGLSRDYMAKLQHIAAEDIAAGDVASQIKAGLTLAEKAKNRLVETNLKLVIWVAKRFGGLPLSDRIQEGNIGLMRAADRFNPRRGAKFSTYAIWWIRQAITRAVADTAQTIRLPVHVGEKLRKIERVRLQAYAKTGNDIDPDQIANIAGMTAEQVRKMLLVPEEPVPMDADNADEIRAIADEGAVSPEESLMVSHMKMLVRRQMKCLTPREDRVIRQRFGIDGDEHTLEQIGQIYGVTRERIRQIEAKALKKLSHPGRIKQLQDELR